MFRISRRIRHLSRTTSNRSPIHLSGFYGIISDFPRRENRCNLDEEISLARVARPWQTRRRHEAAATTQNALNPIPGAFKTVSCPFAPYTDEIEGTHTHIHTRRACVHPGFHKLDYVRWNVRPRRIRLLERREAIQSDSTSPFPFRPTNCVSLHPPSPSCPPPPLIPLSFHFLLPRSRFFRRDRIRELTDAGITIPFVRPAGSDVADFNLEFLSRFGSGG